MYLFCSTSKIYLSRIRILKNAPDPQHWFNITDHEYALEPEGGESHGCLAPVRHRAVKLTEIFRIDLYNNVSGITQLERLLVFWESFFCNNSYIYLLQFSKL